MDVQEKITTTIVRELAKVLQRELPDGVAAPIIDLTPPENEAFGDYTTNVALQTFSLLSVAEKKQFRSPRDWAQALLRALESNASWQRVVAKTEVAGGGFINFYLTSAAKLEIWQVSLTHWNEVVTPAALPPVVVEFSSPNIAKSFTIGHLRSTVIGAAIANLLEAQGWRVYRDNHLGDWGTQFGKQVVAMKRWGSWQQIAASPTPIAQLVKLYVRFHEEAQQQPELEDEARLVFTKMEQGDQRYLALWQKIVDLSLQEFNDYYREMGVKFDENGGIGYGESFFRDKMAAIVDELKEKKLLTASQGAWIVEYGSKTKLPPLMILKKDGSSLYVTRDLATDRFRLATHGPNTIIINEVGKEQSLYFRQLFALEEKLGWVKPGQRRHISHGLYRFKNRKMSTRKGDVIWLRDIVAEAKNRAQQVSKVDLSPADINIIAWGAIKWNDLIREPKNDIDFDLDVMLSLKGNSGSYLQYTVVRLCSVARKAGNEPFNAKLQKILIDSKQIAKGIATIAIRQWSAADLAVIGKLNDYRRVRSHAAINYSPQQLATYLYELAQLANNYYASQPVLGHNERLLVIKAILLVLVDGLAILGIQIPSKM